MSLTSFPQPRPLLDADGNVVFLVTHADYVIDGVNRNNPKFFGSIFLNGVEVFSTSTDPDSGKTVVEPLDPKEGGTGFTSLDELATEVARILGFRSGSGDSAYTLIPISKGGTGATTASAALSALGGASAALYTVNVPVNWTQQSDNTFTQTVSVPGIKNTDVPVVGVVLSSDVNAAVLQGRAFANVNRITTGTNSITIYCYSAKPASAMTIQLLTVRGFTS